MVSVPIEVEKSVTEVVRALRVLTKPVGPREHLFRIPLKIPLQSAQFYGQVRTRNNLNSPRPKVRVNKLDMIHLIALFRGDDTKTVALINGLNKHLRAAARGVGHDGVRPAKLIDNRKNLVNEVLGGHAGRFEVVDVTEFL